MTEPQQRWVAILGRQDFPTDGVEDYCMFLRDALGAYGIQLMLARVPWAEKGRISSLQQLRRECRAWRGKWVLLQYTALAWSQRGFPAFVLAAVQVLRRARVRVAIVFHESSRHEGSRWIDGIRGTFQDWVIRGLYFGADKSIFTVPLDTIQWLPKGEDKAAFIPIGANISERTDRSTSSAPAVQEKTVIVFGVTGPPHTEAEVADIAGVMKEASRTISNLRLVVIGRGSAEARERLANAFAHCDVKLVVRGILPAEEIAREFERAAAVLFVRGALTLRRGSAIAGIACGVPTVAYRKGDISGPLSEAGVEWSPWGDRHSLAQGLVRVLSDSSLWRELHDRNLSVQKKYFSWDRIAERYRMTLAQ